MKEKADGRAGQSTKAGDTKSAKGSNQKSEPKKKTSTGKASK